MSNKIPLILIPGLLNTADLWRHQAAALADLAEITIPEHWHRDSLAAIAADILATAPDRFALGGLSMGGYICLEILRQAPQRVLKLALCDTQARPDTPEAAARRRGFIELAGKGKFRGITPQLVPGLLHPDHQHDRPLILELMHMAQTVGATGFINQQTAILGRPDSRPGLVDIHCPTLVLCGDKDALTPPDLHIEMASLIPDAELQIIAGAGHLSPLEQPDTVSQLLRKWLVSKTISKDIGPTIGYGCVNRI